MNVDSYLPSDTACILAWFCLERNSVLYPRLIYNLCSVPEQPRTCDPPPSDESRDYRSCAAMLGHILLF